MFINGWWDDVDMHSFKQQMATDRWIGSYQDQAAILHAKFSAENQVESRTYRYIFSHKGQRSVLDNFNVSLGDDCKYILLDVVK